jgi:hypothetical protein
MQKLNGGTFEFSPPKGKFSNFKDDEKENEVSGDQLLLRSFSKPPFVDFGDVILGTSGFKTLPIVNDEDFDQAVFVEKYEVGD